jgi:hypothetical protein
MKLTSKDYVNIMKYYKIDITRMKKNDIKQMAEHLLATKLCKCIKSIKNRSGASEKKAIAICYNSVITRKGLKTFKFKCKKGAQLLPKKGTRKLVVIKSN